MNYEITRYEKQGEQVFVQIKSTITPLYLEKFIEDNENTELVVAKLIEELANKDAEYLPATPVEDKIEEIKTVDFEAIIEEQATPVIEDTIQEEVLEEEVIEETSVVEEVIEETPVVDEPVVEEKPMTEEEEVIIATKEVTE